MGLETAASAALCESPGMVAVACHSRPRLGAALACLAWPAALGRHTTKRCAVPRCAVPRCAARYWPAAAAGAVVNAAQRVAAGARGVAASIAGIFGRKLLWEGA